MVNRCGLCQQESELMESHLLPRATYRLARDPLATNPNPIMITVKGARATSKQVAAYFLCLNCEGMFSRKGEAFVLAKCLRAKGQFRLRTDIEQIAPIGATGEASMYDAAMVLRPDEIEKVIYFAASVFWRAGARAWTHDGTVIERLVLGPYLDKMRQYLLGAEPFPRNARLFVHLWSDYPGMTTVFPCTERVGGVPRHKFCIPGMTFIVFLSQSASTAHDDGALNSKAGRFLWLAPFENDSLFAGSGRLIKRLEARSRKYRSV
jgi:hypothetical protein